MDVCLLAILARLIKMVFEDAEYVLEKDVNRECFENFTIWKELNKKEA